MLKVNESTNVKTNDFIKFERPFIDEFEKFEISYKALMDIIFEKARERLDTKIPDHCWTLNDTIREAFKMLEEINI